MVELTIFPMEQQILSKQEGFTQEKRNNLKSPKIAKERQVNKHFITAKMSLLAAIPYKTRKISRKVEQCGPRVRKRELQLAIQRLAVRTSTKCSTINEHGAETQGGAACSEQGGTVSVNLNYFQSYNPYTLGSINSIVLSNGRIYDLLLLKKQDARVNRTIKCRCSKTRCSAKYCDCFANGEACGSSCECSGCQNLTKRGTSTVKVGERFCRCSKSGCRKKYCECFQRGDSCSSKCHCQNCKNTSGELCTHES